MKHILPLTLALAIPALGGSPAPVAPAPAYTPAPTISQWFIGASYGQLNDVETGAEAFDFGGEVDFDLYSLQFGRTFGCVGGFDSALYLEVGYGEADMSGGPFDLDFEMIPVTLNYMLERNLVGGLGCYITAGVGYAFTNTTLNFDFDDEDEDDEDYEDYDGDTDGEVDENDGGFYAQATAGLSYNFTETFEMFAGVRWAYLDSVDWADDLTMSDNDAWGWEVGLRYNF